MASGGGSVFAKQFAGRIKQVGRDGDVRANAAVGAGFGAAGAGGSRVAHSKAKAKSSAPPARNISPLEHMDAEDDVDDEDAGGGTMSCANRDLLRKMLQVSKEESIIAPDAAAAVPVGKSIPASTSLKAPAPTASAPALKAKATVVTASAPRAVAAKPASISAPAPKASAAGATPARPNANEGSMACANRDLLKQMLQSVDKRDEGDMPHSDVFTVDEFDGGFFQRSEEEDLAQDSLAMSSRLVPGTPKAGSRQHNVPTISSPAAARAPPHALPAGSKLSAAAPQMRAVSSTAAPAGPKVKAVASKAVPVAAKSSMPKKILTGPPQRAPPAGVSSVPRPGSRGGATEQVQQLLASPSSRQGRGSAPSTPASAAGRAAGSRPTGYAALHGARAGAKAAGPSPKSSSPVVQQAARPRCGPSAFDMLRKLDETQALQRGGDAEVCSDGSLGIRAEDEEDGFMMPSETSSLAGEDVHPQDELAEADSTQAPALGGRPRPVPLQARGVAPAANAIGSGQPTAASKSTGSRAVPAVAAARPGSTSSLGSDVAGAGAVGVPAGNGDRESAADYVERVKRSLGAAAPAGPVVSGTGDTAAMAGLQAQPPGAKRHSAGAVVETGASSQMPAPPARARSSDPRAAVAASRTANAAGGAPTAGGGATAKARARSSEPRASAVSFSRQAASGDSDDDDDSDDEIHPAGAGAGQGPGGEPWKLDVKSLVKEFAQEERARAGGAKGKSVAPARPPKAPAKAAPTVPQHVPAGDRSERQGSEPGEQLFFSRKPREVDYTPASLESYKQKGYDKKEYSSLKTLGPDLDDENLLMKKAEKEKMKQFSKELQRVNKTRSEAAAARGTQNAEPRPEPKPTARAKALEFAKHLPKPKPEVRPLEVRKPREAVPEATQKAPSEADKIQADWDEIRRREKQHFDDIVKVQGIREFLNQLAV